MISRRLIFEISVALLVFGCIVLFTDQKSENQIWQEVSQEIVAKNQAMERFHILQSNVTVNCSQYLANLTAGTATVNTTQYVRVVNASGAVTVYSINMSAACTTSTSTFVVPKTTATVAYASFSRTYLVVLNMDCIFGAEAIKEAMAAWAGVSKSQIIVTDYSCGSVNMQFQCNAPTSTEAESTCDSISRAACNPSSSLYSILRGTSCGVAPSSGSSSSTSLYGLFALCAIPMLLCGILILWYRNSQREADNQYMQDAATFSNVATSPQPLGVPQNTPVGAEATYVSSPQPVPMAYGSPAYAPVATQPGPYGAPLK